MEVTPYQKSRWVSNRVCQTVEREVSKNRNRLKEWIHEISYYTPQHSIKLTDINYSHINIIIGDGVYMLSAKAEKKEGEFMYYTPYSVPFKQGYLIGFYFESGVQKGDTMLIGRGPGENLYKCKINDINSINRVFEDGFYWPLNCTQYHRPWISIEKTSKNLGSHPEIYALYAIEIPIANNNKLFFNTCTIANEWSIKYDHYPTDGYTFYRTMSGMIANVYGRQVAKASNCNYPYVYHGGKIYRAIRRYIIRKKWRMGMKNCLIQIRSLPGIGVEYFDALNRFNKNI